MDLERKLAISQYNIAYGSLLTEHQREMIRLYYDCDISLNEISEQFGISRQAVRDSLVRGTAALDEFEQKLGLVQKRKCLYSSLQKLKAMIENGDLSGARDAIDGIILEEE